MMMMMMMMTRMMMMMMMDAYEQSLIQWQFTQDLLSTAIFQSCHDQAEVFRKNQAGQLSRCTLPVVLQTRCRPKSQHKAGRISISKSQCPNALRICINSHTQPYDIWVRSKPSGNKPGEPQSS